MTSINQSIEDTGLTKRGACEVLIQTGISNSWPGLKPACVEACPGSARVFGDLNDPGEEIVRMIAENSTGVIKPEMGTDPHTYYINLEDAAVKTVRGHEGG